MAPVGLNCNEDQEDHREIAKEIYSVENLNILSTDKTNIIYNFQRNFKILLQTIKRNGSTTHTYI